MSVVLALFLSLTYTKRFSFFSPLRQNVINSQPRLTFLAGESCRYSGNRLEEVCLVRGAGHIAEGDEQVPQAGWTSREEHLKF